MIEFFIKGESAEIRATVRCGSFRFGSLPTMSNACVECTHVDWTRFRERRFICRWINSLELQDP